MKIGFVIPVLNNFQGALELIDSIVTDYEHKVYIQPQWKEKKALAAAWNTGFYQATADGCDLIFILNDDILFGPDSVNNAIQEYRRLRKDGVVLLSLNNILGTLSSPYNILAQEDPYKPGMVSDHPNYSCFMVDSTFFNKVGSFDENFNPAWWEDNDSHYRIKLLGYRAVCTTAATCVHLGGVSTQLEGQPESGKSENYYRQKWGSTLRNGDEVFKTPYNNPALTPKDWIPNAA